jgi:hypothetical protein
MARAEAVATNFFHGCVFALRNERPFVCEGSQYRCIKVRDLMAAVGGERHLVLDETPAASYDALLGTPLEPEIAQRIAALRQVSEAYLDRVAGVARASQPVPAPQEGRRTVPAPQAA